jgi:beta-lactamase class A
VRRSGVRYAGNRILNYVAAAIFVGIATGFGLIAQLEPTPSAAPPQPDESAPPPPPPTIIPVPAPPGPDVANTALQADVEAAMQAIVPNGSAEVIALGGTLVAQHDAAAPRIAASTIKLALLIELFRQEEAGDLDLSRQVTIQAKDVVGGTGSLQYQVGRTLTLNELAHQMVIKSDNVAANILVDVVGMARVNANAQALNFPNTFFRRHMLDTTAQAAGIENMVSAADLASMMHGIVRDTMISASVSEKARAFLDERGQLDKDWLALNLPAGAQLSHINGTLAGVRNDVGLISSPTGRSFVLAVCEDHLANEASGEAAIARLARRIYDLFEAA